MSRNASTIRGVWRSVVFLSLTFVLLPPFMLAQVTHRGWARRIVRLWSRSCCRLVGLNVRRYGRLVDRQPALLVANHVSYVDMPVIAAHADVIFVAKREVAGWPLFGLIARVARTIFIDRVPTQAARQCRLMRKRLARGENLLLFPEGTSSDGSDLLPFKTSLFEAAHDAGNGLSVPVQPLSLAYVGFRDGTTFAPEERGLYAWHGDATMLPHLWRMLQHPGAEVVIHFHPPVRSEDFASRKDLAEYARRMIGQGLAHDLAGGRGRLVQGVGGEEREERPAAVSG